MQIERRKPQNVANAGILRPPSPMERQRTSIYYLVFESDQLLDKSECTEIDVFELGGGAPDFERKYNMNLHVFHAPAEKRHWNKVGLPDPKELPSTFSIEYVRSWKMLGQEHPPLPGFSARE